MGYRSGRRLGRRDRGILRLDIYGNGWGEECELFHEMKHPTAHGLFGVTSMHRGYYVIWRPNRNITSDMTVCGGSGSDVVTGSVAGIFRGRGGNDRVRGVVGPHEVGTAGQGPAIFDGGPGNDAALSVHRGVFEGGDGNDTVIEDIEGVFNGGAGNDRVKRDVAGVFNGGPGADTVWRILPGIPVPSGTG